MPPIYYGNGRYLPASQVTLPLNDLAFLRGFAFFESLRTYRGRPFLLRDHLARLFRSAKIVGIRPPLSQRQFQKIATELIHKNRFPETLLRFYLTGGPSSLLLPSGKPRIYVLADPLHEFPSWQYTQGIALKTAPFQRLIPEIKSTAYLPAVVETRRALRAGFTEVAYVDSKGSLLEGTTFSIVAVLPGPKLITPQKGVLRSVTVDCILKQARRLGLPAHRAPISPAMIRHADEMFIASSNRELIPVTRLDQRRIGRGEPGPITLQLHAAYLREAWGGTS